VCAGIAQVYMVVSCESSFVCVSSSRTRSLLRNRHDELVGFEVMLSADAFIAGVLAFAFLNGSANSRSYSLLQVLVGRLTQLTK